MPAESRFGLRARDFAKGAIAMMKSIQALAAAVILTMGAEPAAAQERPARVTILSDAFGKDSPLQRSWGYAALVEYNGKRILFDTGGQKRRSLTTPRR
jgi:hypothetical protein